MIKNFRLFEVGEEVRYGLIGLNDLGYEVTTDLYDGDYLGTGLEYQIEVTSIKFPHIFSISLEVKDCIITVLEFFISKYVGFSYNLLYLSCDEDSEYLGEYVDIPSFDIFEDSNITTGSIMLYLNFK